MSTSDTHGPNDRATDDDTTTPDDPTRDTAHGVVGGDDERESREHIAQTGEPQRDALGNADGAS